MKIWRCTKCGESCRAELNFKPTKCLKDGRNSDEWCEASRKTFFDLLEEKSKTSTNIPDWVKVGVWVGGAGFCVDESGEILEIDENLNSVRVQLDGYSSWEPINNLRPIKKPLTK